MAAPNWFDEQTDVLPAPTTPAATPPATAPGTPPATAPPAAGGGQPWSEQAMLDILRRYPATYEGAQQADAEVQRVFGANAPKLMPHATKLDKWQFPDGRTYDAMIGAGGPGASWVTRLTPEYHTPTGGGAGGGGGMAPGGGSYQSIFEGLVGDRPPSLATLQELEPQLQQHGMSLEWNARGTGADIRLPNGQIIDVVQGLEGPAGSQAWQWLGPGGGGGGGGFGGGGGGAGGGGFMAGMDPSYDFRFGEGLKALERSAAAKGTSLTGGTLKELIRYGQGMGSTEFGNIWDRNMGLAGLGLNAAGQAGGLGSSYSGQAGALGGNYGNQAGDLSARYTDTMSNALTGQGNANAAGGMGASNAWRGSLGDLNQLYQFYNTMSRYGMGG